MRILVTNDDGISSPYLACLAEIGKLLGEVIVIAPMEQCSAMAHRITLGRTMAIHEMENYAVEGVRAFGFDATPADCVRTAFHGFLDKGSEPEMVLCGVNYGANCGYDILYSATVGAAMEALLYDVPAICFSQIRGGFDEVMKKYIAQIAMELAGKRLPRAMAWNVNFPRCALSQFRGVQYGRIPAHNALFHDRYLKIKRNDGGHDIYIEAREVTSAEPGTDIRSVLDGFISIGTVTNSILA